jgi:long-chain acyl-CoA synthetase
VSSVVPTQLPMLLSARVSRNQVPTVRHLLVSSAPLASRDAGEFERSTQIPLVQGWGLTEYTNFACCASPFSSIEEHAQLMFSWEVPSIGPALEGTEVRVVDASGASVPEGTRGELVIRGHSTMEGYFRDPDSTARTIDPAGWLHSGDEGFFRTHRGEPIFFVTGRLKELIIRDAEKYSPLRLERQLLETLPELAGRLAVLGFPHREHGEEIGAYIEAELLEDAVRTRLSAAIDAMPVMERPRVVLHGPEPIPRTHTGKVQRRKMQPWFASWISHRGQTVIQRAPPPASISS